jgi:hypothetical protein
VNRNQPLWLPRGSVRAILALSFSFATIFAVLSSLHAGDAVSGPLAALIAVTSNIVTFYFTSKSPAGGGQ